MKEKQYDRLVGGTVRVLHGLMILIAIMIPTMYTVHASILNRMAEKRMANPHTYYLYELLFAEWILGLLLCTFINFKERRIFAASNARYVRKIGILIICKDFVYIPFEYLINSNFTVNFKLMTWLIGAVVILLSHLLDGPEVAEQESKAGQVVSPPLATLVLVVIVFAIVDGQDHNESLLGHSSIGEQVYYEDYESEDNTENVITLSGEELASVKSDFSKDEAAKITEITLQGIEDEEFNEKRELSDKQLPKETRMSLDLSGLSYFPNLHKLTILPEEKGYYSSSEHEDDIDVTYYYNIDSKSLSKLHGVKQLTMKYMNIKDLSFLSEIPVEVLTLEDCNYTEAGKETYARLLNLSSLSIKGEAEGVDLAAMLEKTEHLSSLDIANITLTDATAFKRLKKPSRLEKLSFVMAKDDNTFYETLLQPLTNLKELTVGFEMDYEYHQKAYDLPVLGMLTSLEQLTIKGDKHHSMVQFYDKDYYSIHIDSDGTETRRKQDGTVYTFDLEEIQFHDYSYLKTLKNLKSLTMEHVDMTDVSFVSELSNLTSLSIANNFVKDVTPIQSLDKLEELDLSCNYISDISCLSGLTGLKKFSVGNNKITSIEAVRDMTKLESFDASSGYYYYENPRHIAEALTEVFYSGKESERSLLDVVDYGYNPRNLEDVNTKYLYEGRGDDGFPSFFMNDSVNWDTPKAHGYITLEDYSEGSLWAESKNSITDLTPLANAKKLKFLDVSGNKVVDIMPLKDLEKLEFLSCMRNEIEDVGIFKAYSFPRLRYLYLSQNNFSNGMVLETLDLRSIYIDKVQYYMTPYYNRRFLGLVEPRTSRFHVEGFGIDLINILLNINTGRD